MYQRILDLKLTSSETGFLWGPRQTGKSTLLRDRFPSAVRYDLLLSNVYQRLVAQPSLIRQECEAKGLTGTTQTDPVIIDEVQKVPALIDEVHWLIENRGIRFILCGSSARKLRRGHPNLLGGRAVRYHLHPLVYPEIPAFDLQAALNRGLLPRHYRSGSAHRLLEAYVGDYLREEIAAEALTRNVPAFSRFLEVAALSNGELINFQNVASECGVSAPTVKEYFQILEDTLVGQRLEGFRRRAKRRAIGKPRFYFFDVGVVAQITGRGAVEPGSELFGRAFEHYIQMEVSAHRHYTALNYPLHYWRTASGFEVDLVLGDGEVAVEAKSSRIVKDHHLKGIRAFKDEFPVRRPIVVSMDEAPRKTEDGIEILPYRDFLERLWAGDVVS